MVQQHAHNTEFKMQRLLQLNARHAAANYSPIANFVVSKASGCYVYSSESKQYMDFVSGYSSLNQGHCHPRIVQALHDQSIKCTLTSRAILSDKFCEYAELMSKTFGYDRVLPANGGCEAGETAVKLARSWGYQKKGIPEGRAKIIMAKNNFWGRSIAACSSSDEASCYENFGPFVPGFELVDYNNISDLERVVLPDAANIAAIMMEPVQGEAGIVVPSPNYFGAVRKLCDEHNILLISDEVQTGLGRTGSMLAMLDWGVQPDIAVLGKALSGGMFPISAVLADNDLMRCFAPGVHGSTFGGSPLSSAVAMAAVKVTVEEGLCKNSREMGMYFRGCLRSLCENKFSNKVKDVRGKGLFNGVEFHDADTANRFVQRLFENGLISKVTRGVTARMCPPLIITKPEIDMSLEIMEKSLKSC